MIEQRIVSTRLRPMRRRVFTEDQWRWLNQLPVKRLLLRLRKGRDLIAILYRPEMLNMTPLQADWISSNLRYQMENIIDIIEAKRAEARLVEDILNSKSRFS